MSPVLLDVRESGPEGGREVVPLRHGADIPPTLAASGWHDGRYLHATASADEPDTVVISVVAERGPVEPMPDPVPGQRDPDLDVGVDEIAQQRQRVAAYAWVVEGGAVLLTQLSERVHLLPGWWNLPGGGIDPGEDPVAGVVREVGEETDQRLEAGELLDVHTQHWLGRAPSGALEDFQAVRLIYSGRVLEPTEPVIHDVGGSTSAARWVPLEELDSLPLVASVERLRAFGPR